MVDKIEDSDMVNRCVIDHPFMVLADKRASSMQEGDEQYFMKDQFVLSDIEPCFMCCMAMVHSRIDRLYF